MEAGDVDSLALKLSELANSKEIREALGKKGREIALSEFSKERFEREIVSFIEAQTAI